MPKSTPLRPSLTTTDPFTSGHYDPRNDVFDKGAKEMKGKFVEIAVDDFLRLLPAHGGMPNVELGDFDWSTGKERTFYNPFIEHMTAYLKNGWVLVNTSNHADADARNSFGHHDVKPDISLYSPDAMHDPGHPYQAAKMESFGEFKVNSKDEPFSKAPESGQIEHDSPQARLTRGQLTVYHNAIQATQQRTRVFAFYIRRGFCRLLCHSRSGTQVTPLFDWTTTHDLYIFFWRLSHADRALRGFDTTFKLVSDSDVEAPRARKFLGLRNNVPLFKVRVTDSDYFYVSQPFTRTHTYPVGRGTRCFVAYDPVNKRRVLLKDTWRYGEYLPEHEVYKVLREREVPNILDIVASGDVGGHFQRCGETETLRSLVHYRLVLSEVGKALVDFGSTHEYVTAVRDALISHRTAFEKGVLHRDISTGNIIIVNGEGRLIDWEFAKIYDSPQRAKERTGTLQFLSLALLREPNKAHHVTDDIESFLWVLLWVAIRHASNSLTPEERRGCLAQFNVSSSHWRLKLSLVQGGRIAIESRAAGIQLASEPLTNCLATLVDELHHAIIMAEKGAKGHWSTHDWILGVLDEALKNEEWKRATDPKVDNEVAADPNDKLYTQKSSSELRSSEIKSTKRRRGGETVKEDKLGSSDEGNKVVGEAEDIESCKKLKLMKHVGY